MKQEWVEIIKSDEGYQKLVSKRSRFALLLTVLMLGIYFAYILTIAFMPEVLAKPLYEGSVVSVGVPVGVVVIISAFVVTGIYTYRANREFDDFANRIKANLKEKIDA